MNIDVKTIKFQLKVNLPLETLKKIIKRSVKEENLQPKEVNFSYKDSCYVITLENAVECKKINEAYYAIGEVIIKEFENDYKNETKNYPAKEKKRLINKFNYVLLPVFISLVILTIMRKILIK